MTTRSWTCLATKDARNKKRRKLVDGRIELCLQSGTLQLFLTEETAGKRDLLVGTLQTKLTKLDAQQELDFESGWMCEVDAEIGAPPQPHQPPQPPPPLQEHYPPIRISSNKRRRRTDEEIIALFSL